LTGEIDTDWLKIKEAITKAAEESIGYKKWKNRKWLQDIERRNTTGNRRKES
jgi:hypothetical protein